MGNVKKKVVEKQEINVKTSVKAIITGFVAYGIICAFICFFLSVVIDILLTEFNNFKLAILVPIAGSIFLYYIIHGLCRISTYDVFKKCKTNPDNIDSISKKMNLFFIFCIIFILIISIIFLVFKLDSLYTQVEISKLQYDQVFSKDFSDQLISEELEKYNSEKTYTIISTIIIELGLFISILSLIPFQKKMIKEYNKF